MIEFLNNSGGVNMNRRELARALSNPESIVAS